MEQITYDINGTNPIDYLDSLQEIGNKKNKLWNGYEMTFVDADVKTNCQIFIKDDLHFYRTDYEVGYNILLRFKEEKDDTAYVDFRINNLGSNTSIIESKELELQTINKKEQSFHIFLKRELLGIENEELIQKMKLASKNPLLNKLSSDILSIPATGHSNALRVEGKMLELSYAYLEYLHAPLDDAPSFLSSDYKLNCLLNAKSIIENNFIDPPTIKSLSKKIGMNTNELKVGFKYLFGNTIRQFVITQRLLYAQQLILNTKLPLGTITNKVGYINHGHFSKLYKKQFGLNPQEERKYKVNRHQILN